MSTHNNESVEDLMKFSPPPKEDLIKFSPPSQEDLIKFSPPSKTSKALNGQVRILTSDPDNLLSRSEEEVSGGASLHILDASSNVPNSESDSFFGPLNATTTSSGTAHHGAVGEGDAVNEDTNSPNEAISAEDNLFYDIGDDTFFDGAGSTEEEDTKAAQKQKILDRIAQEDNHYADNKRQELLRSSHTAPVTVVPPDGSDLSSVSQGLNVNEISIQASLSGNSSHQQHDRVKYLVAEVCSSFTKTMFIKFDRTAPLIVLKLRFLEHIGLESEFTDSLDFFFEGQIIRDGESGEALGMGPTPCVLVQSIQGAEEHRNETEEQKELPLVINEKEDDEEDLIELS